MPLEVRKFIRGLQPDYRDNKYALVNGWFFFIGWIVVLSYIISITTLPKTVIWYGIWLVV